MAKKILIKYHVHRNFQGMKILLQISVLQKYY